MYASFPRSSKPGSDFEGVGVESSQIHKTVITQHGVVEVQRAQQDIGVQGSSQMRCSVRANGIALQPEVPNLGIWRQSNILKFNGTTIFTMFLPKPQVSKLINIAHPRHPSSLDLYKLSLLLQKGAYILKNIHAQMLGRHQYFDGGFDGGSPPIF